MVFDFFAKPLSIEGDGKTERLIVERTRLDEQGRAVGTGETYEVPASLVISCIGYATSPIPTCLMMRRGGQFLNDHGQISDHLYCVGWARRGPTGTIGTNRPDGYEVAEQVAAAMPADARRRQEGRRGPRCLVGRARRRGDHFDDWRTIEAAEEAQARTGSPREKMVRVEHWLMCSAGRGERALRLNQPAARKPAPWLLRAARVGSGRGVAQPGRALSSGGRGRRFESSLPDQPFQ